LAVYDSAAKRHRQSEKHRLRNKMVRSRVRSNTRKLVELIESKAQDKAQIQFKEVSILLDRAVSKGIYHRNTAARKKHRLYKLLNSPSA
jgi:small subunit ribosomal protein S20